MKARQHATHETGGDEAKRREFAARAHRHEAAWERAEQQKQP